MNGKRIVISESPAKNIAEVVYHNTLPNGKKDSITRFETMNPAKNTYRRTFPKPPRS